MHITSAARAHLALSKSPLILGICREDPRRIWERRAPLTPDAVHHLVTTKNVQVHIEPCNRRVFPETEYMKAGATVQPNLGLADIILSVKEQPLDRLVTTPLGSKSHILPRTHFTFSHTAKGQPYNTPLLARYLSSNEDAAHLPRLIDYELLKGEDGKRTVGFGWFAGLAGVLESLSSMAHAHLEIGIASPFLYTPRPHTLPSLERLRASLREIGTWISNDGTPKALGPFVIGVTGTGNVAQGCLSMLNELPIQNVEVKDLDELVRNPNTDLRKIYLVHATAKDYLVRLDGGKYDRDHYYSSPGSYVSTFCDNIAPYLTLFLNGAGWSPSYPRLITDEQLTVALERAQTIGGARFTNIGDISCDVEGGLQFMTKATTLSEPFFKTRPHTLPAHLPSVQVMSVDILPASIPLDASKHFSHALLPYLRSYIHKQITGTPDALTNTLRKGTIAMGGALSKPHEHLYPQVQAWRNSSADESSVTTPEIPKLEDSAGLLPKKKILMLGSGMVAGPAVDLIAKRSDIELMIASDSLVQCNNLTAKKPNVQYRIIDLSNLATWKHLVQESDVVISLLPVTHHATVAYQCVQFGKHMVTASYISQQMKSYNEEAEKRDILLLNEIGLDPGIDHCSAIELLSRLQNQNKEIVSFISFCGGLPAPEASLVPLRYKFSWSPAGVLSAALREAQYKLDGHIYKVPGDKLLENSFPDIPITPEFALEGLPNGDSLPYARTYDIAVPTILRGTLRYPGYSKLLNVFKELGLLNSKPAITLDNWLSFIHVGQKAQGTRSPSDILSTKTELWKVDDAREGLQYLGLTQSPTSVSTSSMPPLPDAPMKPIEIFAYLLAHKLRYLTGERDMVVLSHEIITKDKTTSQLEMHKSSLITYGIPGGDTAMARTVGIPVAISALAIADGKIPVRGVQGPWHPSVYNEVLKGLEEIGLGLTETRGKVEDSIYKQLVKSQGEVPSPIFKMAENSLSP